MNLEANPKENLFGKIWRKIKKPLMWLIGIYIILLLIRLPSFLEEQKTAKTVEFIESKVITMADVTGENLPISPNPREVNVTIEGVDANGNWIRDDVELEIFKRYPDDAVIRSAMLQYAMGLQLYLTQVFNSETWIAAVEQEARGGSCVFQTAPDVSPENTDEEVRVAFKIGRDRTEEVENLVLNTENRKNKESEIDRKYTTSFGIDNVEVCDISLSLLK